MNIITNPNKLRGIERRIKVENVSRRSILKGLGIAGGLVLAAPVMSRQAFAAYKTGAGEMPHGTVVDPRVFVAIASDGTVTIVAHRSEMGTGVRTSLPLIVAEEMEADWSRVKVAQAHGDEVKYGNQDTAQLINFAILSQVLNGVLLPVVIILMLLLINRRDLMGEYVNTLTFNIEAWVTAIAMIILSLVLAYTAVFQGTPTD